MRAVQFNRRDATRHRLGTWVYMGISRTFAKSLATLTGNALHGMSHVTDVTVADISDGREPTCISGKDIEARHLSEFQQVSQSGKSEDERRSLWAVPDGLGVA